LAVEQPDELKAITRKDSCSSSNYKELFALLNLGGLKTLHDEARIEVRGR